MVEIKLTQNASRSSDRDPTVCVSDGFYNTYDVASSDASDRDPMAMT